jgi:hypothetical protein
MGVVAQVGIELVAALIGVVAGATWEKVKLLERYGYIRALLRRTERVQIIVSNVEITRFRFAKLDSADIVQMNVPRNVLYMPMPEGRAVAELASLLHTVNPKVIVQFVTADDHDPRVPIFSIGGPSVNTFTARVLNQDFPDFSIDYPTARRAKYEGHIFETLRDGDSKLIRDYGFIFSTRTLRGAPCMVFCGVRAFGTAMAVELFRSLSSRSEAARLISRGRKAFIVADGRIEGLAEVDVRMCFCRELPSKIVARRQRA